VVGTSNRFAYAAAVAVSEKPAVTYNPLFIYGDSGLGKTHLLYSIGHAIKNTFPNFRIVYIKGDDFTNELINAIQTEQKHGV
jgi:chromosomal replication initiator protein